jgi:hypothetical protein
MDDSRKETIQPLVQEWIQERLKSLQEQVVMTWEEGLGRLRPDDALLQKILDAAGPAPVEDPFPEAPTDTENDLGVGLDLIESAASQGEVLKNMLEGLQPFVERSALFVVKQGIASLYAHRGFESDSPRLGSPVVPPRELEDLIQGRASGIHRSGPAYQALLGPLSRFEATDVRILPLRIRRKPVAILLVDSGLRQVIDHPHHIRALAHAAEAALSFQAGQKEEERAAAAPPPEVHPAAPTQRIQEPIAEPPAPALDPKVRANAERSARVLVGDIELYFPAKVTQGKAQKRLYALLRDELERSRASFIERYGAEVEDRYQIFHQTVVQQLCDGDATLLGPVPWSTKG